MVGGAQSGGQDHRAADQDTGLDDGFDFDPEEGSALASPSGLTGKRKRTDSLAQGPRARHRAALTTSNVFPTSTWASHDQRRPNKDSLIELTTSNAMRMRSYSNGDGSNTSNVSPPVVHVRSASHDELASQSGEGQDGAADGSDEEGLDFNFPVEVREEEAFMEPRALSNTVGAVDDWSPSTPGAESLLATGSGGFAAGIGQVSAPPHYQVTWSEAPVTIAASTSAPKPKAPRRDRLFLSSGTGISTEDEPEVALEDPGSPARAAVVPLAAKTINQSEAAPGGGLTLDEESDSDDWLQAYTQLG